MKKVAFLLFAFMIPAFALAQSPDFSGSWKLNTSKSKLGQEFSMAPKDIIIQQKDNDLNVEKHSSFQDQEFTINDKFTLDGRECINPGWENSQKKSSAFWSDDKKSLKITTKMNIGDGGDLTIIEVYKMDGVNMVIESSSTSSYGELVETMFYDKQ